MTLRFFQTHTHTHLAPSEQVQLKSIGYIDDAHIHRQLIKFKWREKKKNSRRTESRKLNNIRCWHRWFFVLDTFFLNPSLENIFSLSDVYVHPVVPYIQFRHSIQELCVCFQMQIENSDTIEPSCCKSIFNHHNQFSSTLDCVLILFLMLRLMLMLLLLLLLLLLLRLVMCWV